MNNSARKQLIESIFIEAIELPPEKRREFVVERTAGLEPEVLQEVIKLLEGDEAASRAGFSELPERMTEFWDQRNQWAAFEKAPQRINNYQLGEKIGEGGMGTVYHAIQEKPVRRQVAIKIIRPGLASEPLIARFAAERQALAMMDHPHIAKVLDAGETDTHLPYFVMEYVPGEPITEYCDQHRLTVAERLQLFVQVCSAVQHAHQKGIIHRDLKPSNVIVTDVDGRAVPKVIDFGLAKASPGVLHNESFVTHAGQILGTWEYMSPEQLSSTHDVDTRSDIYSLGILLYRLLTGYTAFDRAKLLSVPIDEAIRRLRDDDPVCPSERIVRDGNSATLANRCRTEPSSFMRTVKGDLDLIVMKAIDKDRSRRYDTASAFAEDVTRFVENKPIEARAPSAVYLTSKFIRRNRPAVTAAVLFLTFLTATTGLAFAWWQQARVEGRRAMNANRLMAALRFVASEMSRGRRPIQTAVVASEAVKQILAVNGQVDPVAHETLLSAATRIAGTPVPGQPAKLAGLWSTPDGKWLITLSDDNNIRLFDFSQNSTPVLRHVMPGFAGARAETAVSKNGRWLAIAYHDGPVLVWDLQAPVPADTRRSVPSIGNKFQALAFDAQGKRLALCAADDQVAVVDLDAADLSQSMKLLRGHIDMVLGADFSPNGRWLATGSRDYYVKIWDLEAQDPNSSVRDLKMPWYVTRVEFNPEGTRFVVGMHARGGIQLWNFQEADGTATSIPFVPGTTETGTQLLSPNGRWLFCTGLREQSEETDPILLFDMTAEDVAASRLELPGHAGTYSSCGFSVDSQLMVTSGSEGSLRIWDMSAGRPTPLYDLFDGGHDFGVQWALSRDRQRLVTGDWGTLREWDLTRETPGAPSLAIAGIGSSGLSVAKCRIALTADDKRLVARNPEGRLHTWEIATSRVTRMGPLEPNQENQAAPSLNVLALRPGTDEVYLGQSDGRAKVWKFGEQWPGRPVAGLDQPRGGMGAMVITPDGRWLAMSFGEGPSLGIVDLQKATAEPTLLELPVIANTLAVSRNSRWLTTCEIYRPTSVSLPRLIDLHTANIAESIRVLPGQKSDKAVHEMVLSPDRRWLFVGYESGVVQRYDLDADDPLSTLVAMGQPGVGSAGIRNPVRALASDNSGRWVLIARWQEADVVLWDFGSASQPEIKEYCTLRPLESALVAEVSPNGHWLAVGSEDQMLHVWNLWSKTPEELTLSHMVLRGHRNNVMRMLFSSDGETLYSTDGFTTRRWELDVDRLLRHVERVAGRSIFPEEKAPLSMLLESESRQP